MLCPYGWVYAHLPDVAFIVVLTASGYRTETRVQGIYIGRLPPRVHSASNTQTHIQTQLLTNFESSVKVVHTPIFIIYIHISSKKTRANVRPFEHRKIIFSVETSKTPIDVDTRKLQYGPKRQIYITVNKIPECQIRVKNI